MKETSRPNCDSCIYTDVHVCGPFSEKRGLGAPAKNNAAGQAAQTNTLTLVDIVCFW